ncbi:hypothetical protein [Pseudoduganella armeniaca]|uniref:hypothetical protein n=1 Tax=Pseudoduganella armeniaca TaxID=2072590 RepID=UPI0011B298ED|nr:hypothetical protein [Pseudoduganella armeniaca]
MLIAIRMAGTSLSSCLDWANARLAVVTAQHSRALRCLQGDLRGAAPAASAQRDSSSTASIELARFSLRDLAGKTSPAKDS